MNKIITDILTIIALIFILSAPLKIYEAFQAVGETETGLCAEAYTSSHERSFLFKSSDQLVDHCTSLVKEENWRAKLPWKTREALKRLEGK